MAAFAQKDAGALAKFYTKDGQLLPPGSEVVTGRDGIQAFWQGALDMGVRGLDIDTVEIEAHRDTAIQVGKFTAFTGNTQLAGKCLLIWKLEGRSWKVRRDIWNSSQPSPRQ